MGVLECGDTRWCKVGQGWPKGGRAEGGACDLRLTTYDLRLTRLTTYLIQRLNSPHSIIAVNQDTDPIGISHNVGQHDPQDRQELHIIIQHLTRMKVETALDLATNPRLRSLENGQVAASGNRVCRRTLRCHPHRLPPQPLVQQVGVNIRQPQPTT